MPSARSAKSDLSPLRYGVADLGETVWRMKRRLFRSGLVLIGLTTLYYTWVQFSGQPHLPASKAYMGVNVALLAVCAVALLGLRNLENVRWVERFLTISCVIYLYYWDILALWTHYLPTAESLMTSAAAFLLTSALVCVVTPQQRLMPYLVLLFTVHELLTWGNLLHFPWQSVHDAQLITDVTNFMTMLCLSLIGIYQHMVARSYEATEVMQRLAQTDPLTGLSNRRSIYEKLHHAGPAAVLLLDIDDFKVVNDTLGHDAGDTVLVAVAREVQTAVGERGDVVRWGGEEFMVFLPGVLRQDALAIAEQIRQQIENCRFTNLPITLSIGVAVRQAYEGLEATVKRADEHMYAAKSQGKNRVSGDQAGALIP